MLNQDHYAELEATFSPEKGLYGHAQKSPGYHTRVPEGTWVHGTRDNLQHAFHLLHSQEEHQVERAHGILHRILELQDQDPTSATYGVWSWLVEEPLTAMNPPDWNWADFLGLTLARILVIHGDRLPPQLKEGALLGLEHAAHSIFRRNVKADYTNIAIKGACVSVAAGELLDQPWLVRYGVHRLHAVQRAVAEHGGFQEYNSPTYARLVMSICEHSLYILKNEAARRAIEGILHKEWELIAAHYHPATRQLCGPQSRAYTQFLGAEWQDFLGSRAGLWPVPNAAAEPEALPCPEPLKDQFLRVPADKVEQKIQHTLRPQGQAVVAHVWRDEKACLGSINDGNTWNQSRPLLGYWRGSPDAAVALRLSLLHDGRDFASGYVWNAQSGSRVLIAAGFLTDGGDFHVHFDKSPTGHFPVRTLTLRVELTAEGNRARVSGTHAGPGCFRLAAGTHQAYIHIASARMGGRDFTWELREEPGSVFLEGNLEFGEGEFQVNLLEDILILLGLEVLPAGALPCTSGPRILEHGVLDYSANWDADGTVLRLTAPTVAIPQSRGGSFGGS